MSTDQQAAAVTEPTEDPRQKALRLQQEIKAAELKVNESDPAGNLSPDQLDQLPRDKGTYLEHQKWVQSRERVRQELEQKRNEYNQFISQAEPEVQQYAQAHPATTEEKHWVEQGIFNVDLNLYKNEKGSLDYQRRQVFETIERENPNDTIAELKQKYEERVNVFNRQIPNVGVDYASTIALAQETGVHLPLADSGLAETYRKDLEKQYEKLAPTHYVVELGATNPLTGEKPPQPETKPVVPVNPRKKIQEGSTERLYANPEFAQKGSDKSMGIKRQVTVLGSPLPSSSAELSISPLDMSGTNATAAIFGIAPPKPRQLSKAEIANMSQAEIDVYNRQVDTWNQYAGYATAKFGEMKKASIILNRENWVRNREAFAKYVDDLKKSGVKFVNLETGKGVITVPIEQALRKKGVTGMSAVPVIPEGYTSGYVAGEQVLIPEGNQRIGPTKPITKDYIKNFGSELGIDTPIISAMEQKNIMDVISGIPAPAQNLLTEIGAMPEGFYKEATEGTGAGEKFYREKVQPSLKPTFLGSAIAGEPSGKSSAYQKGTILGEVALFGLPGLIAKAPEIIRGLLGVTKVIEKAAEVSRAEKPTLVYRPTNMMREKVPTDVFRRDTASAFATEPVSLGKGVGIAPEEYIPKLDQGVKPRLIPEEPGYNPAESIPKKRIDKIDTSKVFASDNELAGITKETIPLGEGITKTIEPTAPFTETKAPLGTGEIILKKQTVELGAATVKTPEPFGAPQGYKAKPVEPDVFYKPELEMKGYRKIDYTKTFESDTEIAGFAKKNILSERGIGKEIQRDELLGYGKTKIPLGKTGVRIVDRLTGLSRTKIKLGKGLGKQTKEPESVFNKKNSAKLVKEDIFYKPELEKRRAPEKGKFQIEKTKLFARDVKLAGFETTKIKLGESHATSLRGYNKPDLFKETSTQPLGSSRGRYVSRTTGETGLKRFKRSVQAKEEKPTKEGLLMEKPAETKGFKTTPINLGKTEKVGLVAAGGGAAVAPIPLIKSEVPPGGILGNSTGSNGTITNGTGIITVEQPPELDLTPSQLEPSSISERRETLTKETAAAVSGTSQKNLINNIVGPRESLSNKLAIQNISKTEIIAKEKTKPSTIIISRERFSLVQPQKEKMGLITPSSQPFAQPPKLATPEAFKFKEIQKQKFREPPTPKAPKLLGAKPFKAREAARERKRKELKPDNFLGNVPGEQITGMFERQEIIVGIKRTARQEKKDTLLTRKKSGLTAKFVHGSNRQFLSNKKQNLLSREKKPKKFKGFL